jgi:large subunit ribosomal protein L15
MVVKRRTKISRRRGSSTHGWGANKHRNSGSRGGAGNAGSGKKADCKKPSNWGTKTTYFGKHGFVPKGAGQVVKAISIRDLEDRLPELIAQKNVTSEGGLLVVDLRKLGFTKLLGTGHATKKVKVIVSMASAGAAEKLKATGGELVLQ